MKIKLIISYDGTRFSGWQRIPGKLTLQEKVEDALFKIFRHKVTAYGASRTDAGVHAEGQVAHFIPLQTHKKINMVHSMNRELPEDIRILAAEVVPDSFHARESAKSKDYTYNILNTEKPIKKYHSTSWWRSETFDVNRMNEACQFIIGEHDFTSFQSSGSVTSSTMRTILEASWEQQDLFLNFNIHGTGFLKYMIRNLVGTLCWVGIGKISPDDFKKILDKKNRSFAGQTAPASGLSLIKVNY